MSVENKELKPCPFCGSKEEDFSRHPETCFLYRIEVQSRTACLSYCKEDCEWAWNCRVAEPETPSSEFVENVNKFLSGLAEIKQSPDCYNECNNAFVRCEEYLKEACDIIEKLEKDRDAHSKVRQRHLVRLGKCSKRIEELEEHLKLKNDLLICYRLGKRPSDKLLDRLHTLDKHEQALPATVNPTATKVTQAQVKGA
jgi:hypothetical protein